MDELGYIPLMSTVAALLTPDVTDDTMYLKAKVGVSIGTEGYAEVSGVMSSAPKGNKAAYEQAVYWLSFAARRAGSEGNKAAQDALFGAAQRVYHSFGQKRSLAILSEASGIVENSALNVVDKQRITDQLNSNWWGLAGREGLRWGAILGVGSGVAYWIYSRQKG
jgi:hypothetical protein